jgi:heme-degrading monooxygenase HmoA
MMVIRVFRARVQPGRQAEFEAMARRLSVPLVQKQKGMLGFYAGRPVGHSRDEFVMVTLWESVEALKAFVGPDWEQAVVPEEERPVLADTFLHHYEAYATGKD